MYRNDNDKAHNELYAKWLSQLDVSQSELSYIEIEEKRLQLQQRFNERYSIENVNPIATLVETFENVKTFENVEKRKLTLIQWLQYAAAAIVLLTVGIWALKPSPVVKKEIQYLESFTVMGQRKMVTLADGSVVTLNNISRIKFPKVFNGSIREVFLDGEAFFDVVHQVNRPFIVRTGILKVQVLGTSFDVRHYASDKSIVVTVATGKVGVNHGMSPENWMLTPGKQLSFNTITRKAITSTVNPSDYTAWKIGELIFKEEKLESICKKLERWYNTTITIKSAALKSKRFTLKQKNESLATILKVLAASGEFKYKITNHTVLIWQ